MGNCYSSATNQVGRPKIDPTPTKLADWEDKTFPIGATVDSGKYVIVDKFIEESSRDRGIYTGIRKSDGRRVVITLGLPQKEDYAALRRDFEWSDVEKIAKLLYVGPLEYAQSEFYHTKYDAMVELEPEGVPLSKLRHEDIPENLRLKIAYDIGIPLWKANEKFIQMDACLRPEFVYIDLNADHPNKVFKGILPRSMKFLSTAKRPCKGLPLTFDYVYAPIYRNASVEKDAYNFIAMIMYVLTGDPPFAGDEITTQTKSAYEQKIRAYLDKLNYSNPTLKELLKYVAWFDECSAPTFEAIFNILFQSMMMEATV